MKSGQTKTIDPLHETIRLYAKRLKTPSFVNYEHIARQMSSNAGYKEFLCELMKEEILHREDASQMRRIKAAGFPYMKTIDEFDFARLEHVSAAFIRELASCRFIQQKQNIVMIGNPGSGKTHLGIALGLKACDAGLNVRFFTAANLAHRFAEAIQFHQLSKLEKELAKAHLLVVDEMSYLTFNRYQSEMLFQALSERSERASVIVTTNLEFSRWTELFETKIMVSALIDRLTFRSHVLNMSVSKSYRLEQTLSREESLDLKAE